MIVLTDIRKAYSTGKLFLEVLKGISLEVSRGEFLAIMGPSGSGKSTLMNIIGCLDRPTSGRYLLEDTLINECTDDELAEIRNKKIGFVFQTFNLLPRFPAWKNVELPMIYSGIPVRERREMAMALLEKVGLLQRAEHHPSELSGGEQQRVAIARALINNPAVILADEPTGNLDTKSGGEIINLFKRLNDEGVTIILVTHELDVARQAKKIIYIRDGIIALPEVQIST